MFQNYDRLLFSIFSLLKWGPFLPNTVTPAFSSNETTMALERTSERKIKKKGRTISRAGGDGATINCAIISPVEKATYRSISLYREKSREREKEKIERDKGFSGVRFLKAFLMVLKESKREIERDRAFSVTCA